MLSAPEALRPLLPLGRVPVPLVGLLPAPPLRGYPQLLHAMLALQVCVTTPVLAVPSAFSPDTAAEPCNFLARACPTGLSR